MSAEEPREQDVRVEEVEFTDEELGEIYGSYQPEAPCVGETEPLAGRF